MRFSFAAFSIVMLAACSSSNSAARPAEIARSEVGVRLRAPLMFGSSGTAQASFDVTVANPATVPVKVRRIRLSTPAMVEYAIRPVVRTFDYVLDPGKTNTFTMLTEAAASSAGLSPSEPMNMRTEVDFEVNGRRYREVFNVFTETPR